MEEPILNYPLWQLVACFYGGVMGFMLLALIGKYFRGPRE